MDSLLGQIAVVVSILSGVVGMIATIVGLRRRPEPAAAPPRPIGTVYGRAITPVAGRAPVAVPAAAPPGAAPQVAAPHGATAQVAAPKVAASQVAGSQVAGSQVAPPDAAPPVAAAPVDAPPGRVRTNLVAAWLAMLPFVYFGIPALVYAYRSRAAHARGEHERGTRLFVVSRRWSTTSFVLVGAYLVALVIGTVIDIAER